MGIYRRKDKAGNPYGPYIVQYPHRIDPASGKTKYKAESVGYSKRLAKKIFAKKMTDWSERKHFGLMVNEDLLFRQLADWYLDLPGTKRLKTFKKAQEHCQTLKAHFGSMLVREIRPHMIEEYLHKRLSQKTYRGTAYRPASVNREFEVMKRIFNLALREDLIMKNPCWKVPKLPEKNARDRVLSYGEFLRLTEVLPLHAADIVRMGYFTGMRLGEIVGLTWDRVNLKEGYVTLRPDDTKTEKPRRVYLVPQALEVLERTNRIRIISHNHVFTYKNNPIKRIDSALRTALKKTGITNFTFHDLRHTFNTNMRKAGVKDVVTMKLTGHKTLSMYTRYSTVDHEDGRLAVARFTEFLEREGKTTANSTAEAKKELCGTT